MHTDFIRDGGRTATERIVDGHPGTTAIEALNDAMAMGVLFGRPAGRPVMN